MLDLSLNNDVIIQEAWEAYFLELEILFSTKNTELLGYTDYGTNFESFLWELNPTIDQLKDYVNEKINGTFYSRYFSTNVEIEILDGDQRDIYLVLLIVSDGSEEIKKTYIYR